MQIKRFVILAALLAVCLSAVTVNGFAHGHRRQYAVCPQESCTSTANHTHDGVIYRAHHSEDGHSYHMRAATYHGRGCHR